MISYQEQEELKAQLSTLAEKGLAELYKLASELKIGSEDLLRMLANVQGISPELGRRIDYLWQIRFGKVHVKAPKSRLDEPEELLAPRMPELGLPESSELSYIDGLRDHKTGNFYFAINHRDKLPRYVPPPQYDHGMDGIRPQVNSFFSEFLRHKNKSFLLYEAEDFSFDTRLGTEVPPYRIYELELIDIETESLKYGFRYGQGKVLFTHGNAPYARFSEILKAIGLWEQ